MKVKTAGTSEKVDRKKLPLTLVVCRTLGVQTYPCRVQVFTIEAGTTAPKASSGERCDGGVHYV